MRGVGVRGSWLLPALLATVAVFVVAACNENTGPGGTVEITFTEQTPTSTPQPTPSPSPTLTPTATPTPTPSPPPNVCGVNPDPAPPSMLQVQEPQSLDEVSNPFHLRGWGSRIAKDDMGVIVAIIGADGNPLPIAGDSTSKPVPAESRGGRVPAPGIKVTDFTAPFATDILVPNVNSSTPFCIWVFQATDEEGFPKQVVQVPVLVTP